MIGTSNVAETRAPGDRRRGLTLRIAGAQGLSWLLRALQSLLLLEMLLFMAATGLSFFKDVDRYPAFARAVSFQAAVEHPAVLLVKRAMPTRLKGGDVSRWMYVFIVYLISTWAGRWAESLAESAQRRRRQRDGGDDGGLIDLQHTLRGLAQGVTLDRRKLLQIYAETKRTLERQKRFAAFLSVDIVDSTGMKVGETKETAERDFVLYKKMVERILSQNRYLKAAWTPDGVMICLSCVEDAVNAGQAIVRALPDFNRRIKTMKRDFALRVGINAGEVSYDETIPMEEMTDRVIDVAGHMQKHGATNAVCIAKPAIEPLLGRFEFTATGRVVDGYEVYEWRDGAAG